MVPEEHVKHQGVRLNMNIKEKLKQKAIGIFKIQDIMNKRAYLSVALEDYAWIRFSDISSNLDEMRNEFPKIPDDTSSDIIVQDFFIDLRIWEKKWIKK